MFKGSQLEPDAVSLPWRKFAPRNIFLQATIHIQRIMNAWDERNTESVNVDNNPFSIEGFKTCFVKEFYSQRYQGHYYNGGTMYQDKLPIVWITKTTLTLSTNPIARKVHISTNPLPTLDDLRTEDASVVSSSNSENRVTTNPTQASNQMSFRTGTDNMSSRRLVDKMDVHPRHDEFFKSCKWSRSVWQPFGRGLNVTTLLYIRAYFKALLELSCEGKNSSQAGNSIDIKNKMMNFSVYGPYTLGQLQKTENSFNQMLGNLKKSCAYMWIKDAIELGPVNNVLEEVIRRSLPEYRETIRLLLRDVDETRFSRLIKFALSSNEPPPMHIHYEIPLHNETDETGASINELFDRCNTWDRHNAAVSQCATRGTVTEHVGKIIMITRYFWNQKTAEIIQTYPDDLKRAQIHYLRLNKSLFYDAERMGNAI